MRRRHPSAGVGRADRSEGLQTPAWRARKAPSPDHLRCSVGSVRSSSKYHFSSDDMAVRRVFELLANHPLERAVRVRERPRKHQPQRPSGKGPTA